MSVDACWYPTIDLGATREEWGAARKAQKCAHCHKERVNDMDPCIANLPGVSNACCGHGVHRGYVAFESGQVIRGFFDGMPDGGAPFWLEEPAT